MRLVFLISILAAALHADPITVVETKSAGLNDLFYSYDVPGSPGAVTAVIHGYATCPPLDGCGSDQSAAATIDLAMNMYTSGPIRDGMALLQLTLNGDGTAGGTPLESGSIGPYALNSCPKGLTCNLSGFFPFELGVPFSIDLSGRAYGFPPLGGAAFYASASLQLFEVPPPDGGTVGAPVQMNLVPEPGSAGLAFTGLAALALSALRRRRNASSI